MIRSPHLNVMVKALDKISSKIARDFGEIENLQSNNFAASKFANSCYKAVKEKLAADLLSIQPSHNIRFLDGEKITNDPKSKFCYVIAPIDGLFNLSRSIPAFTSLIALEEENDGKKEVTAVVISDVVHNLIFTASKGGGAFLNNRRIRISPHKPLNNIFCALNNSQLLKSTLVNDPKLQLQLSNCSSLNVANLAAGKLDLVVFAEDDLEILDITAILVKEAGGMIAARGGLVYVGNDKLVNN